MGLPRNIESVYVGNFSVRIRKGDADSLRSAVVTHEDIESMVFSASHSDATIADARVRRQFMRSFGRFLHMQDGAIVYASYNSASVNVESIVEAAQRIVTMTPEQVAELHYANSTSAWARTVLRCVEMSEAKRVKAYEEAKRWRRRCTPRAWTTRRHGAHPRGALLASSTNRWPRPRRPHALHQHHGLCIQLLSTATTATTNTITATSSTKSDPHQ